MVKNYLFFSFVTGSPFAGEKTLPNDGSDTPECDCSLREGATGMGLRAEQGLLSTNTGAWPSNTAEPALETDDEMDGDWGRDSWAIRLLTSESGLAGLGAWGTGEEPFMSVTLVGLFLFFGLGLFPLGSGIMSRGISGMKVVLRVSVGEESPPRPGLILEVIFSTEEMEEVTSPDTLSLLQMTEARFVRGISLLLERW